ncbi:MAG: SDR family NAD(P)-dependent oxidoreductase [bacterium]|nr:SDR family NAD(P)-dependent oxidoreductase [bacterium]
MSRPDFIAPDLSGRHVLVTGAGRGIGAAFAVALAGRGAHVHLVGRTRGPLEATAETIRIGGGEATVHLADVADRPSVDRVAGALAASSVRLTALVNNAGILGPVATLPDYAAAAFAEVMRVNVDGVLHVTQAMLPLMGAGASIVNLSSGVGRVGRAGWGAYAASKFAVEGLTQVWADELTGAGIRVNALNPGGTRTAMRAAAKPDEDPMTLPTPEDVVPALLFLLSEGGGTGTSIDARDFMSA